MHACARLEARSRGWWVLAGTHAEAAARRRRAADGAISTQSVRGERARGVDDASNRPIITAAAGALFLLHVYNDLRAWPFVATRGGHSFRRCQG